ncbi:MAG: acyl-CoA dehydrogenase family protein [Rhodobacteraceae bacterium]|nr:acyl-CoA dehydrogenase family protein [Paracoccaceae bacterium]
MDFSWNADQRALHEEAVRFGASLTQSEVAPAPRIDRNNWKALAEFGALGLSVPPAWGGMGLDALTTARVFEGLGYGCADRGLLFSAAAQLFACAMPLAEHGSSWLKSAFLPDLVSGARIAGNAITEPDAGSDTSRLSCRAQREGDVYVLNGEKSYVTNGPDADVFLVYSVTDPSAGHLGVSALLVPRSSVGLTAAPAFDTLGMRSAPIGQVHFQECRVPCTHLVGQEGQGMRIFAGSMKWERACLFAFFLGAMELQLEACVSYARERRQGGVPIARYQAVSHRIADMKLRLDSARLLLYRACWLSDQGENTMLEISLSKLAVSEAALCSGLDAIRLHGGLGYVAESGVGDLMLDALGGVIFSGTSDIQRTLIASKLGLR